MEDLDEICFSGEGGGSLLREARERLRGESVESSDQSSQEHCYKAKEISELQLKGDVGSRDRWEGMVTGTGVLLIVFVFTVR